MSGPQAARPRRRRLINLALPLSLLALAGFIAGALVARDDPGIDAAQRFVDAWESGDYSAMHGELAPQAAGEYPVDRFSRLYERASETSTLLELRAGEVEDADSGSVAAPVTATTNAFGELTAQISIPISDDAVAWEPHLVMPGLERGEELDRRTRPPRRAPILARDGTPLAEGPASARSSPLGAAAANVTGEMGVAEGPARAVLRRLGFPPGTLVGTSGLEKAFNLRLAGTPGGDLLALADDAEPRVLASAAPRGGRRVRTTIDPGLQQSSVAALGGRFGGVAVLDAQDGSIRSLAGVAFSAPQPPGSTFKIVTTVAALEEGAVELDEEFPVVTEAAVGGREIANAHDEPCGGTFVETFADSCNSVFAPLGAEVGAEKLLATAERFGWNSPPALFEAEALAAIDPPASTIPDPIGGELEVAVTAIGQGQVLATPLQMASVAQTIAAGGTRSPTALVRGGELAPEAEPVEVTDRETAEAVRDLMVEVVESGTGTAASLPSAQVAGKTGTAELGPDPDAPAPPPGESPVQEVDAWFTAFAPAADPQLAVAVMIVDADADGGEVAAPIAREVLAAGLG